MLLIPAQRLGIVVLINTNDPIGSFFGDLRIALISLQYRRTALGATPHALPVSPIPLILQGVLLLIIAIQLAGMALTLVRVWRMRSQPALVELTAAKPAHMC